MTGLFSLLDDLVIAGHDDTGWDIGAYIKMAQLLDSVSPGQPMFCCGGSTSFRQAGWLKRLVEVWEKYGPGIYGTQSSYQFRPHLNTNGFMCLPRHLLSYPRVVADKGERYNFEHGLGAWWEQIFNAGEHVKLVTWDGEYDWPEWRKPPNISCRGDQSNCLAYFRINYDYENGSHQTKLDLEYLSDRLTNQSFQEQLCQCHPK
jgi:hypothetical protein